MKRTIAFLTSLAVVFAAPAFGQSFVSGSTGADGALNLSAMSCTTCEVQLPPNGVLNYTTVNVPSDKILVFRRNLLNTPVYVLAQGAVTIDGIVDVSSGGRDGGPGGFAGGVVALAGFGPGAGAASGQASPVCGWDLCRSSL